MSRPPSSVPKGCARLGPCRRWAMSRMIGSLGAIQPGASAKATSATTTSQASSTRLRSDFRSAVAMLIGSASCRDLLDSRVDQRIEQVHDQVDDDEAGGRDDGERDDRRVVEHLEGLVGVEFDAWLVE